MEKQTRLVLPPQVEMLICRLESRGHRAFAVGGCVRDSLLGRRPHDWDLCTSALPAEIQSCFADFPVLETGLAHGTLTVLVQHQPYEITTYRKDGEYTDHRRPDRVYFVSRLEEDLARRDFTINAMAAGPEGLVDLFGGREDLAAGLIRCVGRAEDRFEEDGLRILRGLRFASCLDMQVEEATAAAMEEKKHLLKQVSAERIWAEMNRLLTGPGAARVLGQFAGVLESILPEIAPSRGFWQYHPTHDRDVWGHTLQALALSPPERTVRWALLFHDLGKPQCFTRDETGTGHFYGHAAAGESLALQALARLKADNKSRKEIAFLVKYHDAMLPKKEQGVRAWLRKAGGEELMQKLLVVKNCDMDAHISLPAVEEGRRQTKAFEQLLARVMAAPPLLSPKDLAVNGRDLMEMGMSPGKEMGRVLEALFALVDSGRLPNQKEALKKEAARLAKQKGSKEAYD